MARRKNQGAIGVELTVQRREITGTGSVRRLRDDGVIPGVVYGKHLPAQAIAVPRKALTTVLHSAAGEHALVRLRLDGQAGWEHLALVKTVQHDPLDGHVLHVDFQAISLTERLKVQVPILLGGEPVGVKQDGGVLEHFLRELEVECLPADIPQHFEHDVSAMQIGDTLHVRDLAVSARVRLIAAPDAVVASVLAPRIEVEPTPAAAAVTEPEVIREKKEPAEGEAAEGAAKETGGEKKAQKPDKDKKSEK